MSKFTSVSLPKTISVTLPFERALNSRYITKSMIVNVGGIEILSFRGELGDQDNLKVLLESKIEEIIKDMAVSRSTLSSLESFFRQGGAIPVPGFPGLFLKKESLVFKEA